MTDNRFFDFEDIPLEDAGAAKAGEDAAYED